MLRLEKNEVQKNIENVDSKVLKAKKVKQCYHQNELFAAVKKSWFLKEQEAKGILSNLETKIPLSNIPVLDKILF